MAGKLEPGQVWLGYFGIFGPVSPPGSFPESRTRSHPCSRIERLGLWRLQGFVTLIDKLIYLGSVRPYFCWSFFSFHPKCHPSDALGAPEMQHPSSCSVLSGFTRCWRKPQVSQVVNQASNLIDFQFSLDFPLLLHLETGEQQNIKLQG